MHVDAVVKSPITKVGWFFGSYFVDEAQNRTGAALSIGAYSPYF